MEPLKISLCPSKDEWNVLVELIQSGKLSRL
jgi:hypothetical protein